MTEAESVAHGGRMAYLPMTEVDRAVATGENGGFLKLITGPRRVLGSTGGGRLLGTTAVAAVGGELVHEVALAMRTGIHRPAGPDRPHLPDLIDGGAAGGGPVLHGGLGENGETSPRVSA